MGMVFLYSHTSYMFIIRKSPDMRLILFIFLKLFGFYGLLEGGTHFSR